MQAMAKEDFKADRRLGRTKEEEKPVKDAWDAVQAMIKGTPAQEAIVMKNVVSGTNSLSQVEWLHMEGAMPAEEKQTHKNLGAWMQSRAKASGVKAEKEEEEDDDDEEALALLAGDGGAEGGLEDDESDGDDEAPPKKGDKEEEEPEIVVDKDKNWSAVNLVCKESKLSYRGVLSQIGFTNWMWYRCVRPSLEATKSSLPDIDLSDCPYGIEDIDEIFNMYLPAGKLKKDEKDDKKDKKDKKDKDKDKKDDKKDKKDKKDDKKDDKKEKDKEKDKKKKKDAVTLNTKEKLQVEHLLKNMIFGEDGKKKTITTGWANMIEEKDINVLVPWEFQIAHVMRQCMQLEYTTKKKKEDPPPAAYYEMAQALADAISTLRKQYAFEFPDIKETELLPLQDALALQERFREGSVGTMKFDLLWYLQHGAHLIAGSSFMKRHKTTVFKPFKIQQDMVDAILSPGPQLVFGIAPPGTGKTAVVSHLLNLFPGHSLVFCCAALPVVLGVGRISNSLGLPYAFVKGRRITPSYACGRGLGTHVDMPADETKPAMTALESLKYAVVKLNIERKKKRLALKKRQRNLHNLKRDPRIYLMCDVSSCAWLLRQLNPQRTILVVDEPPMGSDRYPSVPEENPLACAMIQTMLTPMYKTVWMSATLPRINALPTLVTNFLERFGLPLESKEQHVRECFSTELDRGALMCGPSGRVAFPHSKCKTAAELSALCNRLPTDPLVLKSYTERALASLLERWRLLDKEGRLPDNFKKSVISPEKKFSDLSELNHSSIRGYAVEILEGIAAEKDDGLVVAFCENRDASMKGFFPEFNLAEMIFSNAYAFPGLTLVADDHPKEQMLKMSERLLSVMPKMNTLDDDIKAQEAATAKQEKYADDDEVIETAQPKLKFAPDLVIQSEQFLKRWCPNRPSNSITLMRLLPTVKEFMEIKALPVDERWQMMALSGAGSFDPKLDVDPGNPTYTQWVHDSMTLNKLACVTAGKEFTWGANVPASTVVVTTSFAENTSVAGMLQYVGRAARRGLTTHGQAIFEREEDLDRIFASPDGLSTEALTMERYAEWWRTNGKKW